MAFAYGLYNFGDGYYSATKYVDAAATASVSSSVSADSERIHLASSGVIANSSASSAGLKIHQSGTQNPLPSSSASASANYLCNASATVNAQNSVTTGAIRVQFSLGSITTVSVTASNAERIQISGSQSIDAYSVLSPVDTIVTAGGSSVLDMTSGASASGEVIYLGLVSDSATASADSSALVVKDGLVSDSASATTAANCERIHRASMAVDMQSSVDVNGFITANGYISDSATSSASADSERIHLAYTVVTLSSDAGASGRYKYESVAKENETWTVVHSAADAA